MPNFTQTQFAGVFDIVACESFEETARHRQQVLLQLYSECALYTTQYLVKQGYYDAMVLMPFPRISKYAVDTQRVCNMIIKNKRGFL